MVLFHHITAAIGSLGSVPIVLCYNFVQLSTFLRSGLLSSRGLHSAPLHCFPLDPLTPLDVLTLPHPSSDSASESASDSESVVVDSAALSFAVSRSIPSCYHHRRDTLSPSFCVALSQRSRIDRVAMYCATVFCLLVMTFRIPSNPASLMASFRVGYAQYPSSLLRGCLHVIRSAAPCWNLSRARSILGVSTHV